MKNWGKIAVGARITQPDPEFVSSFARLCAEGLRPGDKILPDAKDAPHHYAAEILARRFLQSDCDSLLLVDDDMVFDVGTLSALRDARAGWRYGILSALYCCRRPPFLPIVMQRIGQNYRPIKVQGGRIYRSDTVGLGFTLISRWTLQLVRDASPGAWLFAWGANGQGEDTQFCERAIAAGQRIGVHCGVMVGHRASVTVRWDRRAQQAQFCAPSNAGITSLFEVPK